MPDVIDGSFYDSEGRKKVFARRRDGESADAFAERAMELMVRSGAAFICEHDPDEGITH